MPRLHKDIVLIADPQVHKGVPLDHIHALAKYIWDHKPKYVVHIGDHWDFPSLSYYASAMEKEGRRLVDDLDSGAKALRIITDFIKKKNKTVKHKYHPEFHFVMGNHEYRLNRYIDKNPELAGMVDLTATIEHQGWTVHQFGVPCWIEGICFKHYVSNPESGKAVGGSIENKLNKTPHCFAMGHQQKFQFGRRQTLDGRPWFGIVAGSFYMHDEDYRGENNTEIRGFVHMPAFLNRYGFQDYDVNFVSLERLLDMY